jgi:peptide/nickel transport system permease protein
MINYIIRRLFLFIPTLIAISLLAFIISINAPGDPIDRMLSSNSDEMSSQTANQLEQKKYWHKKLGLDLPVFYFSIKPLSEPGNLHEVFDQYELNAILRLSKLSGNPTTTVEFYKSKTQFINNILANRNTIPDSVLQTIQPDFLSLKYAATFEEITFRMNRVHKVLIPYPQFLSDINKINSAFNSLRNETTLWKKYIPIIAFHGNNQYHRWIFGDGNPLTGKGAIYSKGIIRGDFGLSYQTRQPVSQVISSKIGWSLLLSILSIMLAYGISIPIGVWAGAKKDSPFDKISSLALFILYSLPPFWVATLLLMVFANPDLLPWFPASGVQPAAGFSISANWFEKMKQTLPYLVLPLLCYTYSAFAFISRTARIAMLDAMNQDYIRTAKAKGLSLNKLIFKHAFRNSLLPLITIFSNVFPMAIGGSVIIETIFSIPGMGYETVQAIYYQNYPMIVAVFTISGLLTVTGYLLADVLYALADPRITYTIER